MEIIKWLDWDKHYVLLGKDLESWIAGFWNTEQDAIIDFLKKYISSKVIKDFNYDFEHRENGNFDDSFEYWEACGSQSAYCNMQNIISML